MRRWRFVSPEPDVTVYFPSTWNHPRVQVWICDRILHKPYRAYSVVGTKPKEVNLYNTENYE